MPRVSPPAGGLYSGRTLCQLAAFCGPSRLLAYGYVLVQSQGLIPLSDPLGEGWHLLEF